LAVQEEVDPGLEIALVSWLRGFGGIWSTAGQLDRVGQRHCLRHNQFLLAGSCQAEVLARRQLQVLVAVQVLVLQRQVIVLELAHSVLLLDGRHLFLQVVVGLDGFHAAPSDQEHDNYEDNLADKTGVVHAPEEVRNEVYILLFCLHASSSII